MAFSQQYMYTQLQGTITPYPGFNAEEDCKKLKSAMKGVGTDEKAIISIICYRSNAQRQELRLRYKTMYGQDLLDAFKCELSGDFEKVIVGLMLSPADYDATSVRDAVRGPGTDEAALIGIICTRTNEELTAAKEAYKKLFGKEMEKAVASDISGDFKRIIIACITANRDPDGPVDMTKAARDAKELYDAGEKQWGTDESVFNRIMASRSYCHLRAVFDEYAKITKHHDIEIAIKKEMSGDLEKAMLAIVGTVRSPDGYMATQLYQSMKGLGTDEDTLTRIMVSRSEKDLVQIKAAFRSKYGKTLYSTIKEDVSGDHESALLAICRD